MAAEETTENRSPALPGGMIGLSDWRLPETSVRRSIRDAIRHVWSRLWENMAPHEQAFENLDDMPVLSGKRLARVAPEPDQAVRATALAGAMEQCWGDGLPSGQPRILVTPPFSGIRRELELVASDTGRHLLEPPANLLLSEEEAGRWWDSQPLDQPWVLAELAEFWLRHRAGLALVRELLTRLADGRAGDGIVGCSSWCWVFWARYLPEMHFAPATLAPVDGPALELWLASLPSGGRKPTLRARMGDSGHWVMGEPDDDGGNHHRASRFLRDLAALSRGIPGVALAIWQRSLRARAEDAVMEEDRKEQEQEQQQEQQQETPQQTQGAPAAAKPAGHNKAKAHRSCDCWVVSLDKLSLPVVPSGSSRNLLLILHAILLHNGLARDRLNLVTGIDAPELELALHSLARADLLERSGTHWQVTPLGYPAVRRELQSRGFPVDDF